MAGTYQVALLALCALAVSACASSSQVSRGTVTVYTFRHDSANAHLVVKGESLLLVDSGYERNAAELARDIRAAGFEPARLRALVLTHGHADHAGGARYFQRRFRTPVVAGLGDRAMLDAGKNEKLCSTGLLGDLRHATDQSATFPRAAHGAHSRSRA